MSNFVQDMDIASMYPFSFKTVKQTEVCRILKQRWSGKSHRAKMFAKKRLKYLKNAIVEFDTENKKEWTQKHLLPLNIRIIPEAGQIKRQYYAKSV